MTFLILLLSALGVLMFIGALMLLHGLIAGALRALLAPVRADRTPAR